MKRYLLYASLLLTISLFINCKKDSVPLSNSITGTWELRVDVNGLSGKPTYHKKGNDTLITFTGNNYEFSQKGQVIKTGTYAVKQDSFYVGNITKSRIIYDNETNDFRTFFDIANNQITFTLDAYDAPSTTYERIK